MKYFGAQRIAYILNEVSKVLPLWCLEITEGKKMSFFYTFYEPQIIRVLAELFCHSFFKKFKTRGQECFPFPINSQIVNIRLTNIPFIVVHPRISIHPGPYHVIEGSTVTLPTCHVTGYPAPVVTWRKSSGQLPQGRVEYNNSGLHISNVRKDDSDTYFCSAVNLLGRVERKTLLFVISLPSFIVKPPGKVVNGIGGSLTLNCSATGDPQPVISWKRQGSALPVNA